MNIDLSFKQSRSLGDIISSTIKFFLFHWKLILQIVLMYTLPVILLTVAIVKVFGVDFTSATMIFDNEIFSDVTLPVLVSSYLVYFIGITVAGIIFSSCIYRLISITSTQNREVRLSEINNGLASFILRTIVSYLLFFIFFGFIIGVGALLSVASLIILPFYILIVGIGLFLCMPIFLLFQAHYILKLGTISRSIYRAWDINFSSFGKSLGTVIIGLILIQVASYVFAIPQYILSINSMLNMELGQTTQPSKIWLSITSILYFTGTIFLSSTVYFLSSYLLYALLDDKYSILLKEEIDSFEISDDLENE